MNRTRLGIYHAVSCQDATSLSYDGQPYYEVNMLPRAGVPDECEILFADGEWILAEADKDLAPLPAAEQ
ncbi:hypothetical protein [Brevibacterium ravenspurgense]|uniref:hypothetical protein n=1 Tax=Brevibacterium ravenspurgense TaxID=479117 RepID=UPI000373DEEB|nr:hypothetical protein [Brevibacterium ravenspurgense]